MDSFRRPPRPAIFFFLCLFLPPLLALGPLDLRLEVMTGHELPPLPGRDLLSVFGFKTNSTGRAVFGGATRLHGAPVGDYGTGVFVKDGEIVRKILHSGDALPDAAGVFSMGPSQFMALDINESGSVAIVIPQGILLHDAPKQSDASPEPSVTPLCGPRCGPALPRRPSSELNLVGYGCGQTHLH